MLTLVENLFVDLIAEYHDVTTLDDFGNHL